MIPEQSLSAYEAASDESKRIASILIDGLSALLTLRGERFNQQPEGLAA